MVAELHNRKVVRMPDLVGHPLKKARIVAGNAGLDVDAVLFRESYEDQNVVLEQTPARGQMVYEGSPVTMWVARRGYMELLPAIYRRSDALGRNVVRDICFMFAHMFGSVEDLLDEADQYYDPHECPPEFLPWLASWTAMVVDMDWPESKQRAVIKRAVDLYRIRGTVRGLTLFLKLFTGHEPKIEENKWPFKGFRVGSEARIGHDSVILPPVETSRCFIVTMPVKFTDVTPEMVIRVHQIIQMEKPAHTHHYLKFEADEDDTEMREFFAIGLRSGIGIGAEVVEDAEPAATSVTSSRPAEREKPAAEKPAAEKPAADEKTTADKKSAADKKPAAKKKSAAKKKPAKRKPTKSDEDPK